MTFTDSPDWQEVAVTVPAAGDMPDAPDWQETIVGPGGAAIGGGYKSLTGTGETTTPGDLTQAGGLTVDVSSAAGFAVTNSGGGAIGIVNQGAGPLQIWNQAGGGTLVEDDGQGLTLTGTNNLAINSSGTATVNVLSWNVTASGSVAITASSGSTLTLSQGPGAPSLEMNGLDITLTPAASGQVQLAYPLAFGTGHQASVPTITGSKGGNVALASLLTALATFGLIVDSTT